MGWGPGRGQGSRPGENLGMGSNWAKFILKSGGSGLGSRSGSSSGRAPVTVYPVAQIGNLLNCSMITSSSACARLRGSYQLASMLFWCVLGYQCI